jgi:FixJ family two-component response regulator
LPDIYVVDDNASFRTAIQLTLEKSGYRVVTCASAQQLLDQRPDENAVGCILLDVRMPGLSGPELQSRLTGLGWTLPIVFLTGYTDISIAVKAIKAGADNVLIKPVSEDELLRAIEVAIARHETERALRGELQALRARLSTLTPRQRQIFEIIVRGKTNKHVARELGSSERTIKAHRRVIMEKMKVESLAQLVTVAERLGVLAQASGPSKDETGAG